MKSPENPAAGIPDPDDAAETETASCAASKEQTAPGSASSPAASSSSSSSSSSSASSSSSSSSASSSSSSSSASSPSPSVYSLGADLSEKPKNDKDYKEHLVGHLRELRKRIAVVLAVLAVGAFIFYPFSGDVIAYLWKALLPENVLMSVYSPTEFIMTRLRLSVAFAVAAGFPILMYELFRFMSRGLYTNERQFMMKVVPTSFLLFLFGAGLAYFLVLPVFMRYVIYYSDMTALSQISLEETVNSIITLTLGFGGVFQIPLLMVIAMKMGLVEPQTLRRYRYVVYGLLFSLAFFVSPDPTFFAQVIVGAALIVLFEMSLILVRFL